VEDQWEGHQAGSDGHCAEDDGREGHDFQRGAAFPVLFHLIVFTHGVAVRTSVSMNCLNKRQLTETETESILK